MDLIRLLAGLETNDALHLGRLLILLAAFHDTEHPDNMEGLTKLAKLDFLLRYPTYLERALQARNASTRYVMSAEHEEKSVESSMIRYKYGPWDHRYRRFINILVARGLVRVNIEGRTVNLQLSPAGVRVAQVLAGDPTFSDLSRRAKILKTHFDDSGTALMRFIYRTFPEITTLRMGEEIAP